MKGRRMALTRELVQRAAREVSDAGPTPGVVYMTDLEYQVAVEQALTGVPASDAWVFAYGSLLWKPECEVLEGRLACAYGWHRAFCLRVGRFRGTVDRPGLMMALDRGGRCHGMVFRLADPVTESLEKLFRRELVTSPPANLPRWLTVQTSAGPLRAIAFVANRRNERYTGRLPLDVIAEVVSSAAGHWGSCAEYLHETVTRLEQLGIHDRNLWRLQDAVACRLRLSFGEGGA
jgi:glutathione-specific gamma-glutamylcyclotransferase